LNALGNASLWTYGVVGVLALNAFTVLRFWQDKQAASRGERRIPELNLLGLALIGGTPGAFLARHWFRHKTRKEPFSTWLYLIAAIQVGVAVGLAFAFW
jgi:uncharacterized membrane protein YsdA (DUF1294 family)